MKKFLAIVISMAMIVAMMPMGVFAAGGDPIEVWNSFSGSNNKVASYKDLKDADVSQIEAGKQKIIAVTGNYELSEDFTVPESTYLDVRANAVLTVKSGVTLTVPKNCIRLGTWTDGKITVESGGRILLEQTQENLSPRFMNNGTLEGNVSLEDGCWGLRNGNNLYAVNVPEENADVEIINNGVSKYLTTALMRLYGLQSGDTVKLLKDVYKVYTISDLDNVTFDLNGKKLITESGTAVITASSSKVTITDSSEEHNGKITYEGSLNTARLINAYYNSEIIIEESAEVSSDNALCIYLESNAKVTIKGKVQSKNNCAISGNGTDDGNTTIKVLPGAEIKSENGAAIYHPHKGTVNITGGIITGKTGVQMCAGTLNISREPVINVTGKWENPTGGDGYVQDGAADSILNRN